jgi:diaminohydroxyphosphoribosylaminopyrimidine deaminase/5-amino-6-(5-phosphoribosylamino)uracil reductase
MTDQDYMRQVLRLARKGIGKVSPNPMVGALIVKNDRVLSKGYHARFGGPHAEVDAISKLSSGALKGATLYVNLEPCTHYGKTPPCTDAILKTGIRKVVIGMTDPNPLVNRKGILKLKKSGIEVTTSVLEKECRELNAVYIKWINQKKPFITLKIAQTLDGKIAVNSGQSRWITGQESRKQVHKIRNECDAILVGINTVLHDDPQLTVRLGKGKRIKKIILDSRLRIPDEAGILTNDDPENTILATTPQASKARILSLQGKGISIWVCKSDRSGRVDLKSLWRKCLDAQICSVLVEGGREVFTSVLNSGEADRMVFFTAPKLFGEGIASLGNLGVSDPDSALTFRSFRWKKCGPDMIFDGRL